MKIRGGERGAIYVNPFVGSRRCRKMCPILQYRPSDLYLTDRKETMTIYPHSSPHLQIRPYLIHPFLPQDLDFPCNARASCQSYKNRVGDDGVPGILQYRPSGLYLTDRKKTMAILQKYTHTPLHVRKYGLPSFILFSHKINYSQKCILLFRATHGHLASFF